MEFRWSRKRFFLHFFILLPHSPNTHIIFFFDWVSIFMTHLFEQHYRLSCMMIAIQWCMCSFSLGKLLCPSYSASSNPHVSTCVHTWVCILKQNKLFILETVIAPSLPIWDHWNNFCWCLPHVGWPYEFQFNQCVWSLNFHICWARFLFRRQRNCQVSEENILYVASSKKIYIPKQSELSYC